MSVDPKSPWAVQCYGRLCETCTVTDRMEKIRNADDMVWL